MTTTPHTGTVPRTGRAGHPWWALTGFVVGCQLAGAIGIPFNQQSLDSWYDGLDKPSFNPPSWVFGPVWTVLYLLIAVAAWLIWRSGDPRRVGALALFGVQLALNAAWSPIFFGARRPGWALAELVVLWVAVAATTVRFAPIDRRAAALMAPYLGWVSFAAVLNASIVALN